MKNKYLFLMFCFVVITVLFFAHSSYLINTKLTSIQRTDRDIRRLQEELNSARVLSKDLEGVSVVIENSLTSNRELSIEEANNFAAELYDLANNYQISVNILSPRVSLAQRGTLEQQFSMDLECTYVQLGQFLASLERYDYILRVNTLDVRPLTDKYKEDANGNRETLYKITMDLAIFKIVREA
jgi:hypothetical protein